MNPDIPDDIGSYDPGYSTKAQHEWNEFLETLQCRWCAKGIATPDGSWVYCPENEEHYEPDLWEEHKKCWKER